MTAKLILSILVWLGLGVMLVAAVNNWRIVIIVAGTSALLFWFILVYLTTRKGK